MARKNESLGYKLKDLRAGRELSLREVERDFGINSGYLSQLESDKISSPSPSMLKKLSAAYRVPMSMLMEWAGYIEPDEAGTSPHVQTALKYLPSDVSEEELKALKAVLGAMRGGSGSGGKAASYQATLSDLMITLERRSEIRKTALALLREIDAVHSDRPVDLDDAMSVANLVRAGAIELHPDEKEILRTRFKGLVDRVLSNLEGVVHLGRNEVYVKQSLHAARERFVLAHEIGHSVLEEHREVFAHLDDRHRLAPDFNNKLEREANQFSIELLAKGNWLRDDFDSSNLSVGEISRLASQLNLSHQATARRAAEESRHACAVALAFRSRDGSGPLKVDQYRFWASTTFEARFGWSAEGRPHSSIQEALALAATGCEIPDWSAVDRNGDQLEMHVEGMDAFYSVFVLLRPAKRRVLFRSNRRVRMLAGA